MPTFAKFVLIASALVSGFYAGDIIKWFQSTQQTASLDDYCLVTTNKCQQGDISVQANKDVSHPLVPTVLSVNWTNTSSESLIMTLQGYEMEMGTVVFKLEKSASGLFSGQIILPVCTTTSMTWFGSISDGNQSIKTSIRMEQ
ncbi:hypothetical protein TW81_02935 [Vibrio galatheae]|uniref:Uncharacterized protein n=1 Tax=Vibrio galatheae TaxID=579748 RepID=A0A0F4NRG0_9VIBR|nr:hypothetical protein [Vibrio galatheae]KJY84691.1 hypothetical protein TW81_02935 [Vibrio galatheae]